MSNESILLLIIHLIIFLIVRYRITRKKKQLEIENAKLRVINEQQIGKIQYYMRKLQEK